MTGPTLDAREQARYARPQDDLARPKTEERVIPSGQRPEWIRAMLARFRDALAASTTLTTGDHDARLLLFPPSFNNAMRELDRCLEEMRTPILRRLRFHTLAWYVDVDYVQRPVLVRKASRQGWVWQVAGYRLEPHRLNDANEIVAAAGVNWLARRYRWERIHLKEIREACGEQIAA